MQKIMHGVYARQHLQAAINDGRITVPNFVEDALQADALELTIGSRGYIVPAGLKPHRNQTVQGLLDKYSESTFELTDERKRIKRGQVHIFELEESLNLRGEHAYTDTRSSVARPNNSAATVIDGCDRYGRCDSSGEKKMYLEFTPNSWDVYIKKGLRLSQMRLTTGSTKLRKVDIEHLCQNHQLLYDKNGSPIDPDQMEITEEGIIMHADLQGEVAGYQARSHPSLVFDLTGEKGSLYDQRFAFYQPWPASEELHLPMNEFYLLATLERISFPDDICGTMLPVREEFLPARVHDAGQFGAGFGKESANSATLEVTPYKNYLLRHGDPVCVMQFHRMCEPPKKDGKLWVYGNNNAHTVQTRGPHMPKQCMRP